MIKTVKEREREEEDRCRRVHTTRGKTSWYSCLQKQRLLEALNRNKKDFRLSNGRNQTAKLIMHPSGELPSGLFVAQYNTNHITLPCRSPTSRFDDNFKK